MLPKQNRMKTLENGQNDSLLKSLMENLCRAEEFGSALGDLRASFLTASLFLLPTLGRDGGGLSQTLSSFQDLGAALELTGLSLDHEIALLREQVDELQGP